MIPHNHRMSEFSIFLWWGLRTSSSICLVQKSCQRHLCLHLRLYQDQWNSRLLTPAACACGEAQEWDQLLPHSFPKYYHLKNLSELLANKWSLFLNWGLVCRKANYGVEPRVLCIWTSTLPLRSKPNLVHFIKIFLSVLSRLALLTMNPLLTALWHRASSRQKPFQGLLHHFLSTLSDLKT